MRKYTDVYKGETPPKRNDVLWVHHSIKDDLTSPLITEIFSKGKWISAAGDDSDEIDRLAKQLGDIQELDTLTHSSAVDAINEVVDSINGVIETVDDVSEEVEAHADTLYGYDLDAGPVTIELEQGPISAAGEYSTEAQAKQYSIYYNRVRPKNLVQVNGSFKLTFTNTSGGTLQHNVMFYTDNDTSTYSSQQGVWDGNETYTGSHMGYLAFNLRKSNNANFSPSGVSVTIERLGTHHVEGLEEIVKGLLNSTDGFVMGADMIRRPVTVTKLGTLSYLQAFCYYDNKYYSIDDYHNIGEQDSSFTSLRNSTLNVGHGNSLQLVDNGKAWVSGWNDNTMYRVNLSTFAIDQTVTLPTEGYTTGVVDEDNKLMYIFQRGTYPSTPEKYKFIIYNYNTQTVVSTRVIESFCALQSVDYYQGKIVALYGLGLWDAPSGMRVYNTNGDVLAYYDLTVFREKEPEGVMIRRDTMNILVSDVDKNLYEVS